MSYQMDYKNNPQDLSELGYLLNQAKFNVKKLEETIDEQIDLQVSQAVEVHVRSLPDPEIIETEGLNCYSCDHHQTDYKYCQMGYKSWADVCTRISSDESSEIDNYTYRDGRLPACQLLKRKEKS